MSFVLAATLTVAAWPGLTTVAAGDGGEGESEGARTPGCGAGGYLCTLELPYRSRQRSDGLFEAAERRILLELAYEARPAGAGCESRLETAPGVEVRGSWRKRGADGSLQCLELGRAHHPSGTYELLLYGSRQTETGSRTNPDLAAALKLAEALLDETAAAPLGGPEDKWFTYQLNYIQADRALALLAELGYSVIRFGVQSKSKDSTFEPSTVQDLLFQAEPTDAAGARNRLRRPTIVQLIDSATTSLVGIGQGGAAGGEDSTLSGGSPLTGITSGAPEQRFLIVYDKEDLDALEGLLNLLKKEIDVPARQILIEALVIELDRDRLRDLGLSFSGSNDGTSFSFNDSDRGLPFLATFARPSERTLFDLSVELRALVDEGDAQVLSRPSVLVLDGRQARIKIADEIPYLRAQSTNAAGGLTTDIDFLTAGIILNLRPRATDDGGEITLQVETIISSAGPSGATAEGIPITPTVQSREVQTFVRVANDTPFIIGGLIATTNSKSVTGVPGLSKIPGLGRLFRKENSIKDRKEVAVMITPHVIEVEDRDVSLIVPKDSGLFNSFDNTLFRNIYRLRSSDIFDLRFIWENHRYLQVRQDVETVARRISRSESPEIPQGDRDRLVEEVAKRLEERSPDPDPAKEPPAGRESYVEEQRKNPAENFLQFLEGGVPGEEILAERMLAGVIRHQRFDRFTQQVRKIILFADDGYGGIKVQDLEDLTPPDPCARAGEDCTLLLHFQDHGAEDRTFAPPIATASWDTIREDEYRERLRLENERGPDGSWCKQAILLRSGTDEKDPLKQLRVVLVLKRLLDLNQGRGLLALKGFQAGREVAFPTLDDLRDRNHLIDRRAAQLFYETQDYYWAFEKEFERLSQHLDKKMEPFLAD